MNTAIILTPPLDIINRYVVVRKISRILSQQYGVIYLIIPFGDSRLISRLSNDLRLSENIRIILLAKFSYQFSIKLARLLVELLAVSRILNNFIKNRRKTTVYLLYPSIFCALLRFLGYKIVLFAGGFVKTSHMNLSNYLLFIPRLIQIIFQLLFVNYILVESPHVSDFFEIFKAKPIRNKVISNASLYVPNSFTIMKPIHERAYDLCYAGVLDDVKGFPLFLIMIQKLAEIYPRIKVAIAGTGGAYKHLLNEKNIKRLGLDMNVVFFDSLPNERMPYFFNTCKLLVLLSKSEGVPNVALEAMACGVPVLATPVGGIPDIIKSGYNGILVATTSPEKIAEIILNVLTSSRLSTLSVNAYSFSKRNYSFESCLERWRKIILLIEGNNTTNYASVRNSYISGMRHVKWK